MKPKRTFCAGCNKQFANWQSYLNHAKNDRECTPEMRFWGRVNKNAANGCWTFLGCLDGWGYGDVQYKGKHIQAHRLGWLLLRGDPGELDVLHKCNTPPCCNPDHMYLGTDKENAQDRLDAGVHYSKLKPEQVREIKAALTKPYRGINKDLAKKYGVSDAQICTIKQGRQWAHIK